MKAVPVSFLSLFYFFAASISLHAQVADTAVRTNNNEINNFHHITSIKDLTLEGNETTASPDSVSSLQYTLRNENATLRTKLWRGEKLIGGAELAGMGILILLPKKVTKWQDDWMQDAMRNLKRSWTNMPVWDHDDWGFNYLGHPIAGSYYYNAIRSQNASVLSSFAFSAFQSTLWEYVVEGIAERPSIQDLFVTPIGGAIVGELTHRATLKMQRRGFSFFEKAFVLVFNPMYAINNGFKKKYKRVSLYN